MHVNPKTSNKISAGTEEGCSSLINLPRQTSINNFMCQNVEMHFKSLYWFICAYVDTSYFLPDPMLITFRFLPYSLVIAVCHLRRHRSDHSAMSQLNCNM